MQEVEGNKCECYHSSVKDICRVQHELASWMEESRTKRTEVKLCLYDTSIPTIGQLDCSVDGTTHEKSYIAALEMICR